MVDLLKNNLLAVGRIFFKTRAVFTPRSSSPKQLVIRFEMNLPQSQWGGQQEPGESSTIFGHFARQILR